jgi:hypothetical protein
MRLLGRGAECEFLDAALIDALDGWSRVVVLRGEAGNWNRGVTLQNE